MPNQAIACNFTRLSISTHAVFYRATSSVCRTVFKLPHHCFVPPRTSIKTQSIPVRLVKLHQSLVCRVWRSLPKLKSRDSTPFSSSHTSLISICWGSAPQILSTVVATQNRKYDSESGEAEWTISQQPFVIKNERSWSLKTCTVYSTAHDRLGSHHWFAPRNPTVPAMLDETWSFIAEINGLSLSFYRNWLPKPNWERQPILTMLLLLL